MKGWFTLCVFVCACGGGEQREEIDLASLPEDPETLRDTGFFRYVDGDELGEGLLEYAPVYELWSDGAAKTRWIMLPEGEVIGTEDQDDWVLPVGTRIWKEFSMGATKLETRLIWKTGDDEWFAKTFLWNEAQDAAVRNDAGRDDVLGTNHDVPSSGDCRRCHGRLPAFALGYGAVALIGGEGLALEELIAQGLLSDPPQAPLALPGDATAQAALGTLHTNCGGCHHPASVEFDNTPINMRLTVGALGTVEETTLFQSTVDKVPALTTSPEVTHVIASGDPDASAVVFRMASRGERFDMPPLATDEVDTDSLAAVRAWIESLP